MTIPVETLGYETVLKPETLLRKLPPQFIRSFVHLFVRSIVCGVFFGWLRRLFALDFNGSHGLTQMTLAMCSGSGLKQRSLHDSTWCLPTSCAKIANDVIGAPPRATWFLFVCQGQPLLHPWYLAGASFLPTGWIVFSSSSGFGGFFMMKKWDGFKSATMVSQVFQSQDSDSRRQGLCDTALCDWNKVENPLCGLRLCWRKSMLKALCDQWCVRKNFTSWLH